MLADPGWLADSDAGWFGKQHVQKGGVRPIKAFFNGFTLDASLQSTEIAFNIFQAGLMLSYAAHGGDQTVTDAMIAVTDALSGKGKASASKSITALEKLLAKSQDKVVEHLNKLIAKAPG